MDSPKLVSMLWAGFCGLGLHQPSRWDVWWGQVAFLCVSFRPVVASGSFVCALLSAAVGTTVGFTAHAADRDGRSATKWLAVFSTCPVPFVWVGKDSYRYEKSIYLFIYFHKNNPLSRRDVCSLWLRDWPRRNTATTRLPASLQHWAQWALRPSLRFSQARCYALPWTWQCWSCPSPASGGRSVVGSACFPLRAGDLHARSPAQTPSRCIPLIERLLPQLLAVVAPVV